MLLLVLKESRIQIIYSIIVQKSRLTITSRGIIKMIMILNIKSNFRFDRKEIAIAPKLTRFALSFLRYLMRK